MPHTSIYLTGEEAESLDKFCKANGCSKSQALKYGLMQLSDASAGLGSGEHNGDGKLVATPLESLEAKLCKAKELNDAEDKENAKRKAEEKAAEEARNRLVDAFGKVMEKRLGL